MPSARKITKPITNRKNRILAIPAAAPAIPPKPSAPAMRAMTAKIRAHLSISRSPNHTATHEPSCPPKRTAWLDVP